MGPRLTGAPNSISDPLDAAQVRDPGGPFALKGAVRLLAFALRVVDGVERAVVAALAHGCPRNATAASGST
jgi:hypothetical protein